MNITTYFAPMSSATASAKSVPVSNSPSSVPSPIPTKRMRLIDSDSDCEVEKPSAQLDNDCETNDEMPKPSTERRKAEGSVRKRGKGKKNLPFLCSGEEISADILKTSAFKDFKVVGDAESAKKTAVTGKHTVQRASLSKAARSRSISVVLHNETDHGKKKKSWRADRYKNNSKYSLAEIL